MAAEGQLIEAARELSARADQLRFGPPVAHVYNPLVYAWPAHEQYVRRFGGAGKEVLFLGMNPGPFGMAQTGVPFGEIAAVRDWMKIDAPIGRPPREHPRRPVLGLACPRSEVSGRRLWALFARRFGTPGKFFARHFVVNYCPLAFLGARGENLTPDKLPAAESEPLTRVCDAHLGRILEILRPKWIIGVGAFAAGRARAAAHSLPARAGQILHPSPASPAANRDWAGKAAAQLQSLGVWK
ncbi:MAG: uracil-DNA glycosylase family protein [Verrucomicrobiota bacterium]|jgi:single-strand selective monofunctional uracil DNA glycosylase